MFSQTVEYALRAVVAIARHDGACCTAQRISEIAQIPSPYLSKVMQKLVRANLVSSKRGVHGGFALLKPAAELTLWEVVDAVEPIKRIRECPLGIAHKTTLCPLHRRLDDAIATVEKAFCETAVDELLAREGRVMPFCEREQLMQIDLEHTGATAAGKSPANKSRKNKA